MINQFNDTKSSKDKSASDSLEDEILRLSIEEVRNELTECGVEITSNADLASYGVISEDISAAVELEREILSLEHGDVKQQLLRAGVAPCTDDELENIFIEMVSREPSKSLVGIEQIIDVDSGATVVAVRGGVVVSVAAGRIAVQANEDEVIPSETGVDIYTLTKYIRSARNTYMKQRPLVRPGDVIVRGDALTSAIPIHIEELNCVVRDTKLGSEEITANIPISKGLLSNLDESGIAYIGAEVKPNDILVGKVTPMTPEEKLLRSIFGEKTSNSRNASLYVPKGMSGTVIGVRVITHDGGIEKDAWELQFEELKQRVREERLDDEWRILENDIYLYIEQLICGQDAEKGPHGLKKGDRITSEYLKSIERDLWLSISLKNKDLNIQIERLRSFMNERREKLYIEKKEKIASEYKLAPGVLKMVKVYLAANTHARSPDPKPRLYGEAKLKRMLSEHSVNKPVIDDDLMGMKESFNVLLKEIRSLGVNIKQEEDTEEDT